MARVSLDRVNKIYPSRRGAVHAVVDLDMEVKDGEFVALLGPSGCGKSSTLRMIVGLEAITSGEIRFDDRVINDLEPEHRNVAMAFETYALYPNFTVAQNLGFPLEVRGVNRADRDRRVGETARLLNIEDILESEPAQLSGGQQQRVSLGRALIRDPDAFILDEVMSHLDAHLKFQMMVELRRLHQSLGKTMIYVTHDQMEALALADRVAVMHEGRLLQFGTRNELYHRPANRFIADFIGEPPTNFFTARVEEADGEISLRDRASALRFRLTPERAAKVKAGNANEYLVGLRPQNLFLDPGVGADFIAAAVQINEYLGERCILTLAAGDTVFRALADVDAAVDEGGTVELHYRRRDVMVFDATTESLIA